MRKKYLIVIIVLISLLLTACSTSVRVGYNRPSEIDMGRYRNIAVASAVPFKGFQSPGFYVRSVDDVAASHTHVRSSYDRSLADEVASYATGSLLRSLSSTGFFNITPPEKADRMISKNRLGYSIQDDVEYYGIDAFIIPRIVSMDVNEYLSSERYYYYDYSRIDENGKPLRLVDYRYYLTQSASIVYSYTVIDARTMTVYVTKNFSDKTEETTEVGRYGFNAPDPVLYFEKMIDNISRIAAFQLAPSRAAAEIELMSNKPDNKSADAAYDYVKDGNIAAAQKIFRDVWRQRSHLPSGYNYALLLAVEGNIDSAIGVLEEIQSSYAGNGDVLHLLCELEEMKKNNAAAQAQIDGTAPYVNYTDSSSSIFALVMGD